MAYSFNTFKLATTALAAVSMTLSACAAHNQAVWEEPKLLKPSPTMALLANLPAPGQRIPVAVYGFTDQTGQFKHSDNTQSLSRAVTQGATSILIKALQDSGRRGWFQVIERERLDNVLRERAVIREMRANYLGEKKVNPNALPPLLFAGILLEGGIIGYDSNTKSGGAGGRFLGIGAHTQYREDTITLFLRAVSVKTGEVLSTVSVRKTIASVSAGADAFRYVAFKDLLEAEVGFAYNEPDEIALQQAIEKAVHSMIMEGAVQNLWCFNTTDDYANGLIRSYMAERDSVKEDRVTMPAAPWSAVCRKSVARAASPASPSAVSLAAPIEMEAAAQDDQDAPAQAAPAKPPIAAALMPIKIAAPAAKSPVVNRTESPSTMPVKTAPRVSPTPQVAAQPKEVAAKPLTPVATSKPAIVASMQMPAKPTAPQPIQMPVAHAITPPTADGAQPAPEPQAKEKVIEPESQGLRASDGGKE